MMINYNCVSLIDIISFLDDSICSSIGHKIIIIFPSDLMLSAPGSGQGLKEFYISIYNSNLTHFNNINQFRCGPKSLLSGKLFLSLHFSSFSSDAFDKELKKGKKLCEEKEEKKALSVYNKILSKDSNNFKALQAIGKPFSSSFCIWIMEKCYWS